ncbi:serine/threonine-protein kinase Vhs1p [Diutina catenulata]
MIDDYTYSLNGYVLGNYQFIRKVGAGTYGLIYLVEDMRTGQQFAAKMLLKSPPMKLDSTEDNKRQIQRVFYRAFTEMPLEATEMDVEALKQDGTHCPFLREISLHLRVASHPNVVSIHAVLNVSQLAVIIIMDHFDQGDLFHNIIDQQMFTAHKGNRQALMKNVMLQLIDAVEFCAKRGVYHCDLKPENIMVRYNPKYQRPIDGPLVDYRECQVVLIDFGLAMSSNLICCNACRGSSFYMAPERLTNYSTSPLVNQMIDLSVYRSVAVDATLGVDESNRRFFPTLAGDIWSLGVLFINVTCGRNPWPAAQLSDASGVFRDYMVYGKTTILSQILPISHQFNRVLDSIFKLNPNDRVSLSTLRMLITDVDIFNDFPPTPPAEPVIEYGEAKGEMVSPQNSQMESCRHQLKQFNCPHHHFPQQSPGRPHMPHKQIMTT